MLMKKTFGLLAAAAICGAIVTAGGAAYADTGTTVNLTVAATADGSPGISTHAGFGPSSVEPGATTTMGMGTDTPANICRTTNTCAPGYPNNGAVLTISGVAAAGLTFVSNGDTSAGCVQQDADTVVCHYQYFNNYHKSDNFMFAVSPTATAGNYTINVDLHVFSKTPPADKTQCKNGGWTGFNDALDNPMFTNQGDCVSYVATGGKA
jgi:hypothetical protein